MAAPPLPPRLRAEYPFTSRWHDADGFRMHYVDEGPRTDHAVLLVHGNPVWSYLWRHQVRDLAAEGVRVVAADQVGFGRSDKPDDAAYHTLDRHARNLAGLVDALGLDRVTLGVHDWGGPIGLAWATERPDLVASLVILDTWAWLPERRPRLPFVYAWARRPGVGELLFDRWNAFVPLALRFGTRWGALPRGAMRAYRHPFRGGQSRAGILAFMRGIPYTLAEPEGPRMQRVQERLPLLRAPKALLWGERDPVLPLGAARRFQRIWPDASLRVLPGARHFLQEEEPEAVTATLRAALVPAATPRDS